MGVSRLWVNQVEWGEPGASLGLILRALAVRDVPLMVRVGEDAAAPADPIPAIDINAIIDAARQ